MKIKNTQENAVIITGAAGGIGQALVKTFVRAGYFVIAVDQIECPIDLNASYYLQADLARTVTNEAYAESVFTKIQHHLKTKALKSLINNAAVQILGKTDELSRDDWQKTLQVNLLAPFFWTQAFLLELKIVQGCVVNISSIHARLTKREFVAYATSKAALSGMTRSMAVDLGGSVRVVAIEPGAIETGMLRAGFDGKPELYCQLEACHPVGRIGKPDEVAKLALAVVDGGFEFLQGACIGLDGGISGSLFDPI